MSAISNASPIILLAKVKRLGLLRDVYGTVEIPSSVKLETVDRGKRMGDRDVVDIESAIEAGWVKVVSLSRVQTRRANKLVRDARVGMGEAETVVLARDRKLLAILDDKEARGIAQAWGLEYTGTAMVLYEAFTKRLLSYDELVECLSKLARVMWISTDVITEIIKKASEVRK